MTIIDLGASPHSADEYLMATEVTIKNFRSFENETLSACKRINIVVGENGSGKTALLEALFLATSQSPEVALRVKGWRGFDNSISGADEDMVRALWGDLFHNYDRTKGVWIRLSGTAEHTRLFQVTQRVGDVSVQFDAKTPMIVQTGKIIRFQWKGPGKTERIIEPVFEDGKLKWKGGGETPFESAFFAANQTYMTAETVMRLSDMLKENRGADIIENFCRQFPVIKELAILMQGASPMVFATTDIERKIPINLVSGGMNKLASILFAFPKHAHGIILIDEFENGFFHKRLPEIWAAIVHFAKAYNVQVFASTHSQECLESIVSVAEKAKADDFSLIRAVHKDGKTKLRQFSGDDFIAAVNDRIEVR